MSDLDDAIARLERAVARLEAAPERDRADTAAEEAARLAAARFAEERGAEAERVRQLGAAIANRVEAALGKIAQALREDG